MEVKIVSNKEDMLKCWEVLKELRPHLQAEDFVPSLTEMIKEGYTLAFIEQNRKAVAAIGFRYVQFLGNGKNFYVDDIAILSGYRGKGYSCQLLDFVAGKAKSAGYKVITPDTGYRDLWCIDQG